MLIILIVFVSGGIIYLNCVTLPTKIKSLIINSLQERTQKEVSLESLQFSIFRGLVLRNLIIYDDKKPIVSLREGSCTFLILPVFRKMLIIPSLKLKYPEIFLQRRKDETLNLQDLFFNKTRGIQQTKFKIFVYRVTITNTRIHFQDNSLAQPFVKNIENLSLNLYLSLTKSVKFTLKSEILANPIIKINAAGEFKIPEKQLIAKISLQDLSPHEFSAYYQHLGININEGLIDCWVDLQLKDNFLYADLNARNKNLIISKERFWARLNSQAQSNLQYNLKDKQIVFFGKAKISDSSIWGLELIDAVKDISGEVAFNNSGLSSDRLSANIWGVPINAKINLSDFTNPLLNINVTSALSLVSLRDILKDKFKFALPGDIKGEGNLSLAIQTPLPPRDSFQINGYLDILNGILKLEKVSYPMENINGRLQFSPNQLKWSDVNFKYLEFLYKTTGVLTNFQSPQVQLEVSTQDLYLESNFTVNNKLINLSKCKGRYLNSEFSATGDIDTKNLSKLNTDVNGELAINLEDIKWMFKRFSARDTKPLEQIKPEGLMHVEFSVNGDINDFKSCAVWARLSSPSVSVYGLKSQELSFSFTQADGIIDIAPVHLSLYDGTIAGRASMNLNSTNLPYWVSADIQGIKIEKLKLDTGAREKDIAGTIKAQVKLNGSSFDLSGLSGVGNIFITEGKLWQINLFKGLGSLLFARDFANIIFSEGSCGFSIADKYIFTDNLKLKSNITNLSGSVKLGFNNSIDASLNVEILDEMVPLTGTFKDITTAIITGAGRLGVIKISGTLKEPKYKFQPQVADIIKGLKDVIFGK